MVFHLSIDSRGKDLSANSFVRCLPSTHASMTSIGRRTARSRPTCRALADRARVVPSAPVPKEICRNRSSAGCAEVYQFRASIDLAAGPHVETSPRLIEVGTRIHLRLQHLSGQAFPYRLAESPWPETMDHEESHSQDPRGGERLVAAG